MIRDGLPTSVGDVFDMKTAILALVALASLIAIVPGVQAASDAEERNASLCATDFVAAQSYDTGDYSTQLGTLDVLNYDSYTVSYGLNTAFNGLDLALCSATYLMSTTDA